MCFFHISCVFPCPRYPHLISRHGLRYVSACTSGKWQHRQMHQPRPHFQFYQLHPCAPWLKASLSVKKTSLARKMIYCIMLLAWLIYLKTPFISATASKLQTLLREPVPIATHSWQFAARFCVSCSRLPKENLHLY